MEKSEQGVSVDVRADGCVYIIALSRDLDGLLGAHGNFKKLQITDSDELLGATIRACLNDRKPGLYVPHMHKEKEAHSAMMEAFYEDRGIKSDKVFYKGTKTFGIRQYSDRIEFRAADNTKPGRGALWVKGGPHVVIPHNASNTELAQAMRRTLNFCLV